MVDNGIVKFELLLTSIFSSSIAAILNLSETLKSHAHLHIMGNVIVIFFIISDLRVFASTQIMKLISGGHFEFQ